MLHPPRSRAAAGRRQRAASRMLADLPPKLARQIHRLARDHRSGSAVLALRACEILGRCPPQSPPRPRAAFRRLAHAVAQTQPAMAAVQNVCMRWLQEVHDGASPEAAARHVAQQLAQTQRSAADGAARLLRSGQRIATWSASSTVEAALLLAWRQGKRIHVLCAEGRPLYEGRLMASRLAARGVAVELFTDAALLAATPEADVVLVGCDAIVPGGFINKVGTRALLAVARNAGVPAYVVGDSFKRLSAAAARALLVREESPAEVWKQPEPRLRIRNFYFEKVPRPLCSGIITERGVVGTR